MSDISGGLWCSFRISVEIKALRLRLSIVSICSQCSGLNAGLISNLISDERGVVVSVGLLIEVGGEVNALGCIGLGANDNGM